MNFFRLPLLFTAVFALMGGGCVGSDESTERKSGSEEEVGTAEQALTTINWSGYTWNVKNGNGLGPGPNNWSDSSSSVFIDGTGSLNLKVRKSANKWYCAEVWLPTSLGYGTYEFFIKTQSDDIDKQLVEGFFLYQDDTHELDMEWSLWGNAANPYNGGFAVQPYTNPGNQFQFQQDIQPNDWHKVRIIWSPTQVEYQVETNSVVVQDWVYTGADNFVPGSELVHINNWLFQGKAPSGGTGSAGLTLTLVSFTYTP